MKAVLVGGPSDQEVREVSDRPPAQIDVEVDVGPPWEPIPEGAEFPHAVWESHRYVLSSVDGDVEDRLQPGFYGGAFSGPFFVLRHGPPAEPPVVKGVTGRFSTSASRRRWASPAKPRAAAMWSFSVRTSPVNASRRGSWTRSSSTSRPSLVGGGIRLFERPDGDPVRLIPTASIEEGKTTVLRYSVSR